MKEIKPERRWSSFPDGNSALMLSAARLRHLAGTKWGTRKLLDMQRLYDLEHERRQQEEEEALSVADVAPRRLVGPAFSALTPAQPTDHPSEIAKRKCAT